MLGVVYVFCCSLFRIEFVVSYRIFLLAAACGFASDRVLLAINIPLYREDWGFGAFPARAYGFLDETYAELQDRGLLLKRGAVVAATMIAAPRPSPKTRRASENRR